MNEQEPSQERGRRGNDLRGLRVLIVEDWLLVAIELTRMVQSAGCVAVGPANDLEQAMRLASDEPLDGAVLDVNLHGHEVFPVAQILRKRGIPFVFVTGYENLPAQFAHEATLEKPFSREQLLGTMLRTFARPEQSVQA